MSKQNNFLKNSKERRELEEISHLYFSSDPSPSDVSPNSGPNDVTPKEKTDAVTVASGAREAPHRDQPSPAVSWPLLVCTAVRPKASAKALSFLYNLAILLKIANDPGLLVCSEYGYRNRFSFDFRPDREQWPPDQGQEAVRSGLFGPMGIRLIDILTIKRLFDRGSLDGLPGRRASLWGSVPFHYVLSDEPSADFLFENLPSIVLFLVSPDTPADAFQELEEAAWSEQHLLPPRAGVVVSDVSNWEEANQLYADWRGFLKKRHPDSPVESYGVLPWSGHGDSAEARCGMSILEDPSSWRTRFFQGTTALIRKARAEMLAAGQEKTDKDPAPATDSEPAFRTGMTDQENDRLGHMLSQVRPPDSPCKQ